MIEQVRKCDVLDSRKDVRTYHVLLCEVTATGGSIPVVDKDVDLCPRALLRAVARIEAACAPPKKRVKA